MRVERTGSGQGVGSTRRASPAGGGGNFAAAVSRVGRPAGAEGTSSVSSIGALTGVEALVALQEVDGDRAGRKRARDRASSILESLDELRLALLDGRLTGAQIERLVATIASQRALTDDPRLNDVLDEIDLRAQVELAKYQSRA